MGELNNNHVFQGLVLSGIWILIMRSFGMPATKQIANFQSGAIGHMDQVGNQSSGAKEYRREVTYPMVKP
jgi:ascorbate-specific PTS system EIIC-type component UlaA